MSLLKELQEITERTYQQTTGINLEKFVVGRKRYDRLSAICTEDTTELSHSARVFLRRVDENLYLAIYFSDDMIAALEKNDPRRGLSDKNICPFIVFIEEINHGVHAALKFMAGEKHIRSEDFVRDLELLAKIDTYLVLKFFLAYFNTSKQLENFDRLWLRFHLFERNDTSYYSRKLTRRYSETNLFGDKFTRFLDSIPVPHRLNEIRRFREMPYRTKLQYIRMLP
ncbi:MAG: hypothetical protein ACE5IR_23520 [bacterium]